MTEPVVDRSPAGPRRQQRGIRLPQLMLSLLVVGVLKRGTIISGSMFSLAKPLEEGQGLVGLQLDSSRAPFGLSPGDTVQVLIEDAGDVLILAPDARVDAIRGGANELIVRLRMSSSEAQRVQLRASEVVLIEVSKAAPLSWEPAGS